MADLSYWGMNKPSGEYKGRGGLPGLLSQRGDILKEQLSQPNADLNALTRQVMASPEMTPEEQRDSGMGLVEKAVDFMNPLPISGLGTIIGSGAKSWSTQAVQKAKALMSKGASKQEVAAKTGYYKDRAGHWKSQISDAGSEVDEFHTQFLKSMTPLQIRKAASESPVMLKSMLKHQDLYENYPWLATKAQVKVTNKVGFAAMAPKFDREGNLLKTDILVNPDGVRKYAAAAGMMFPEALRTMLLHEANHAVQTLDNLPGGNAPGWIKKIKGEVEIVKKALKKNREIRRQLPASSPRAKELLAESTEMEGHIKLLEAAKDVDSDVLYRHSIGEGDSFWVQSMKDDPNVMFKLPSHEQENPRLMMEGNTLPLQPGLMNVTKPGMHPWMTTPEAEIMAQTLRRGAPQQTQEGLKQAASEARRYK